MFLIDWAGSFGHEVGAALGLGEGDHVSDIVSTHEQHDESIQAEGNAAVGGGTLTERIEKETELHTHVFFFKAEYTEYCVLHLGVVDTDRAAADLGAVEDHVIAG